MSYLAHYNLTHEAFTNAPDLRMFWPGAPYEAAMAKLRFAVEARRGLAVCTAPVGHGKTTIARRMFDELSGDEYVKGLLVVIHSDVTPDWLLRKIGGLLGCGNAQMDKLTLLSRIYARLRQIDEAGKTAVILVDEVQMLASRQLMEEFRGLLNIELSGRKLINFVFFGLPETEHALALDPPLRNRVALRVKLSPFDAAATAHYVAHRLVAAGGRGDLFSDAVLRRVHEVSEGTPRTINTVCDNLLLWGVLNGSRKFTVETVGQIAEDLGLVRREPLGIVERLLSEGEPGDRERADTDWDFLKAGSIDEILGFLGK
ncbi:AAA family ATPase [bacterium]|nr:AAA family ATPase [bacterium]